MCLGRLRKKKLVVLNAPLVLFTQSTQIAAGHINKSLIQSDLLTVLIAWSSSA